VRGNWVDAGAWCIGTPDDLAEYINRLDEASRGFGKLIILASDLGTREQMKYSYKLVARYVMPKFQGTTTSLNMSNQVFRNLREELIETKNTALADAKEAHEKESTKWLKRKD